MYEFDYKTVFTFVQPMKSATGITLIFIFTLYFCGVELLYSVKLNKVKSESAALITSHKVPLDNSSLFSFTAGQYNQLNWSERNKEFTYKGNHYDIINLAFYTDEIVVTCYDDSKETSLADAFANYVKQMFTQQQKGDDRTNDVAGKICKEYFPNKGFAPTYYFHVVQTVNAPCVLVNQHALVCDVWRPPSIV
jgi:hypothetical protein